MSIVIKKFAFGAPQWKAAWAVRVKVFVEEQKVPPEMELDEYDKTAAHFAAVDVDEVIGTARIVRVGNAAKIGRVAVLLHRRGEGVGWKLMLAVMEAARAMGVEEMFLTAQVQVIKFYERLGFVAEGDVFEEAGIPHRLMRMKCGKTNS
jgi:ElaA protein